MKTQINNLQKKMITLAVIALSFFIGSFAQKSNAQFFRENSLKSLKSIITEINSAEAQLTFLLSRPAEASKTNNIAFIYIAEKGDAADEDMQVEKWMLSASHFMKNKLQKSAFEIEIEKSIPLENWMLDESYFLRTAKKQMIEETEEKIEIEEWMLDATHFISKDRTIAETGTN